MEILDQRALRGPNFFARFPVIYMELDIGRLEETPSDELPGLNARVKAALPSLVGHRCSPGVPGGFFQRLDRGTWAGHIVEHIAIELQCLAGMEVGYGKTRELAAEGVYSVVFRYRDEACGLMAGERAVQLLEDLIADRAVDVDATVRALKETREANLFGPSTASIVDEATRRGIPHRRLNAHSHVLLGQGHRQRHIQASMTDGTTVFGVELAADKAWSKRMFDEAGIAVPEGRSVKTLDEARAAAHALGWPVVVKPLDANHGRGITTEIGDDAALDTAYGVAKAHHDTVVVERHLVGDDHRLLLIGGRLVAAARREPAHVVGDGTRTVRALIDVVNSDPRRGYGHERTLTQVEVDPNTLRMLAEQGLDLDAVPAAGARVVLRSTANLSTGGTATDITDEIHPSIRFMAERVARIVGLDIMGIDIVAPHLHAPLEKTGGGIVEVNAAPGLRMHLDPTHGVPRDVAGPIIDLLFPEGDGRIPTVAVAGTNGKTTTARLIAHCLKYAGARVGLATTDGVEVENQTILRGDHSGPQGAQAILREPTTTHAVMEVSRGGILRRGMGIDRVDIGIVLNVRPERMGVGDIHDEDDLLQLAATVPDVSKTVVLNMDDPIVRRLHETPGRRGRPILFTTDDHDDAVRAHLAADPGHMAVVASRGAIEVWRGAARFHLAHIADIPITLAGKARSNIENTLAAVAACVALGVSEDDVRTGILTFNPTLGQNPGRMNVFEVGAIRILVDHAHNVHAIRALDEVIPHLKPREDGRILRVAHAPGPRSTHELEEIGAALATHCDHLWVSEPDPRHDAAAQTAAAVRAGATAAGVPDRHVITEGSEQDHIEASLAEARDGDLVILQCHDHERVVDRIRALRAGLHDGAPLEVSP